MAKFCSWAVIFGLRHKNFAANTDQVVSYLCLPHAFLFHFKIFNSVSSTFQLWAHNYVKLPKVTRKNLI